MKRFLDIILSLLSIIVLSPVFIIAAIIIFLSDGAPVLFAQKRVGFKGELFDIYKFRTLKKGTREVATADLTEIEQQLIPFGKIFRKTSLDELPQLFNVLNGTMSFIGPRPLIPDEKEIHSLRMKYNVYSVKPGITGLAQVNGRDNITIEQKALLDKEYVEHRSIGMDAKIFLKTIVNVLAEKDVKDCGDTTNKE